MRKSKVKLGGIRNVENVGNVKHWYNNKRDIQMEKMEENPTRGTPCQTNNNTRTHSNKKTRLLKIASLL